MSLRELCEADEACVEELRGLKAGTVIVDGRGRRLFRTVSNGWITVSGSHIGSRFVDLPYEVVLPA